MLNKLSHKNIGFLGKSARARMRTGSEIYKENDIFLENTWHSYLFDNIETHFFKTYRYP